MADAISSELARMRSCLSWKVQHPRISGEVVVGPIWVGSVKPVQGFVVGHYPRKCRKSNLISTGQEKSGKDQKFGNFGRGIFCFSIILTEVFVAGHDTVASKRPEPIRKVT